MTDKQPATWGLMIQANKVNGKLPAPKEMLDSALDAWRNKKGTEPIAVVVHANLLDELVGLSDLRITAERRVSNEAIMIVYGL